ncbi:MAG: methyltransferase domain-containing protein [Chromatiales bacterium]
MRHRLLEILRCPSCDGAFKLEAFQSENGSGLQADGNAVVCRSHCGLLDRPVRDVNPAQCVTCFATEIVEGRLLCSCGKTYPIVGGIPRLLPDPLLAECVHRYHREFLLRHADKFSSLPSRSRASDRKSATMHAFGYQWTTFVENFDYFRGIFLSFVQPFLCPEDFKDKLVLEVGCGSGRPASIASSFGAEVVAFDLSEAVQTAHAQSRHYRRLHVVQGDAYALPFRACFDFVYSVGVIQHLPDPSQALKSIARILPAGHKLVIWVYGKREPWYQPIEWLRKLTTRMPYALLHGLSTVLAAFSEMFLLIPYRVLASFPPTRPLAEKIPGRVYAGFPFKENVLGWFDRLGAPVTHYFSREDVEQMMLDAGFTNIEVIARPGASASWIAEATRCDTPSD